MSIRNIIRSISIAGLLCGIIFPVQAYELSDASKQKYLAWAKKMISEGAETALAVGPNGCGGYHWGITRHEAKGKALKICKSHCKGATCEIIDVSLESDFIKKKGYSGSSTQTTTSSSNASMSDNDKRKYLAWLVKLAAGDAEGACWGGECVGVLAVAPSGCWAKHPHKKVERAKVAALNKCKTKCNRTCLIKDVGGTSSFIKGQDSSSSTTTASSSTGKIWCANKHWAMKVSKSVCKSNGGKVFYTQSQAEAEHKRLKGQSTASSSGTNTYCHDSSNNLFYKAGGSGCVGSDKKITQQEYSNRRLNSSSSSSTTSSVKKIWCATSKEVLLTTSRVCKSKKGKVYYYEDSARKEHERLKEISKPIWCATKYSVISNISRYSCNQKNGKAFSSKYEAQMEHKRLKEESTASGSGTNTYCHDPNNNLFYKKSGNVSCSGSDNKITQQEYSNRRLKSSTESSSGNVWCAHSGEPTYVSTWKCKSLTGKGFTSRAQAQEYDKLNKDFEELAGENMALRAVGRELVLEISELRQELERLRKKLED